MRSTDRLSWLSLLVLPYATGLGAGCQSAGSPEPDTEVVSGALSTTAAAALGFESLANWQISSGTATLGSPRTQGQTALRLQSPVNYTTIASRPLALTATDIAPLTVAGAHVAVDIALPTQQPNPWWFGDTQMFVSCPSRGVHNQYLGITGFTGRRLGNFQTYRYFVPDFVRQQLQGQSCADFSLTLVINVPSSGTGLYRVDNIRFRTPDDPGATGTGASVGLVARRSFEPPSSTPGTATFAESRIQVPESFHVATGRSGTGQLTLLLALTATDRTTCTYTGADAGTSYRFTSCTRGEAPGDLVIASSATLTIVSSDPAGGETKVKAQLAINPTGDELVSGLVPIPTFWGNTAAEVSTISAAYFNRVAASGNLQDGATVTLPTPEIGNRGPSTIRTRNLLDPNAPPLSPLDPPFDEYGDVGGNDLANAYWRLHGAVDGAQFGDRFTTHVDATARVHGVLLGIDIEALRAQLVYDSDSGTVGPTGNTGGSRTGSAGVFVFGNQVASVSLDQSVNRTTLFSETVGFSVPAFTFGIFSINLGMSATVGVDLETVAAFDALQFSLIPSAVVRGTISGVVDILVASGGIEASVELINLGLPITARAGWGINTQPAVCAATLQFLVNAVATVSVGAGSVDARVTFGNCGFFGLCHTERWNIVRWGPLLQTTIPFVTINETPAVISLPRTACDQPFDMAINCVGDNETLPSGLQIAFGSTAEEPPGQLPDPGPGGPIIVLPTPIPCAQRTWTTNDPSDTIVQQGCTAIIQFGNPGPRTVTMTATNGFQTAAVSKPVVVAALVGGAPVGRIINPIQGCVASYLGGTSVPLQGVALDPDAQTPLTFTWDYLPDGSSTPVPIGTGQSVTFTTPLLRTLNAALRMTVTDAGGTSTTVTTPLLVQTVF